MEKFMQTAIASMRRRIPARRTKLPDTKRLDLYMYDKVKAMIVKAAKVASSHSGVPFEEMKAQADLLFVSALRKYDRKRKVKFSTFLYSVLHNGLIDYGKDEVFHDGYNRIHGLPDGEGGTIEALSILPDERQSRQFSVMELYNSLSPDQVKLVDLVLNGFVSNLESLRIMARDRLDIDQERFQVAVAGIRELMGEF